MQRALIAVLVYLGAASDSVVSTKQLPMPMSVSKNVSPVTRIVELLKGLKEQCEVDAKKDEKLYEKFVCWGREVIKAKEASNKIANAEMLELKQYVEDLDAGRIELTTERVDLEKEISELTGSIEIATDQRKKENADYENAVAEMGQAIEALEEALEVLRTATAGHADGVLLAEKVQAGHREEAEAKETMILKHAVELGDRFLSKGDALFLRRMLTGEVPEWDWKKLNRKATFKMSYKARSFKIQDVLAKLLETFQTNRQEATDKENEAQALFDKLMESKNAQLSAARIALAKMEKETAARAMSRGETVDRINLLSDQLDNDEKYIQQVQTELSDKKQEWTDRANLRYGEINAISKAIQILHNDDARDLFKKSLESQGYQFVQTGMHSKSLDAAAVLRSVAEKTKDKRLLALVEAMQAQDPIQPTPIGFGSLASRFDLVIQKIDSLISLISSETSSDMTKKEECEKARADSTRQAILKARSIDDDTDTMTRLQSEIDKLVEQIKENQDAIAELDQQMKDATLQRNEENAAYLKDKSDDTEAASTVQSAYDVLHAFYTDNNLMLVQKKSGEPVPVQAGEAPPPPPKTWDSPYDGRTAENTGILAILSMIKEDIERDSQKCTDAENKAKAAYDALMIDLGQEKSDRQADINAMTMEKGTKEGDFLQAKTNRGLKKTDLDSMLDTIAEMEPGCEYYTLNWPLRQKNRQLEVDGLLRAKAILLGAGTDVNKDKDRKRWEDVPRILRPKEFQNVLLKERTAAVHKHQ